MKTYTYYRPEAESSLAQEAGKMILFVLGAVGWLFFLITVLVD